MSVFSISILVARTSQRFFIPPISASLIANVCLYVSSYFGFKKLQEIKITEFLTLKLKECARLAKCSKSRIAHMEKVETMWVFFTRKTCSVLREKVKILSSMLLLLWLVPLYHASSEFSGKFIKFIQMLVCLLIHLDSSHEHEIWISTVSSA